MVKLAEALKFFRSIKALVVGDFMLDTYTTGRVKRISPEAPVPVFEVLRQESRPGGTGNVVLSLAALGAQVIAVGRIGADREGELLKRSLLQERVSLDSLLVEEHYKTPVKNRFIAESQQLLRVDQETTLPISPAFEETMFERVVMALPHVDVVALSDYGKGLLTNSLIARIISSASRAKKCVVVDPKGHDFTKYRGATVLKPNLSEAYGAASLSGETPLDLVAARLMELCQTQYLLITRSEEGISIYNQALQRTDFPVLSKEVKDVTGAGDTVLAVVSAGLANGLELSSIAQLANIAAGIAIERIGCVAVTLSELAKRLLELDADSKVFDDSHLFALQQVLEEKSFSLLVLPKGQMMSNALLRAARHLQSMQRELIVYICDSDPDDEFVHLLASLHEVNYIILQSELLKTLCQAMSPREIYFLRQEKLHRCDTRKEAQERLQQLVSIGLACT